MTNITRRRTNGGCTVGLDLLRDYVYLFAQKACQTYLEYLKWDDQAGPYTISPAKPYECGYEIAFEDTITDLSMIRHLFPKLIEYSKLLNVDAAEREKWHHILDHLWDPPVTEREGLGTIYAEAYEPDGKPWPEGKDDTLRRFHFSAGSALAFPGDVLDLEDIRAYAEQGRQAQGPCGDWQGPRL